MIAAGSRYEGPADWGVPLYDEQRAAESRRLFRARLAAEGMKVH